MTVSIRNEKQRKYRLHIIKNHPKETFERICTKPHSLSICLLCCIAGCISCISKLCIDLLWGWLYIILILKSPVLHPHMLNHMRDDNTPGKGGSYEQESGVHRDQEKLFPFLPSVQRSCDQLNLPQSCQLSHLHWEDSIGYLLSKSFVGHKPWRKR